MLAATIFWVFLAQMPGDSTWIRVGRFDTQEDCEEMRTNWKTTHPNFESKPCQLQGSDVS